MKLIRQYCLAARSLYKVLIIASFAVAVPTAHLLAQYDGGLESVTYARLTGHIAGPNSSPLAQWASAPLSYSSQNEQLPPKIKNIVTLNIIEETPLYLGTNFTASVQVRIDYGASIFSYSQHYQTLTVTWNKDEGVKYNARNYFSFNDAQYVNVTVLNPPQFTPANIGISYPEDILMLTNEMRVTRYYQLQTGISLPSFPPNTATNPVDEHLVSWPAWPTTAGSNGTQLEWTWLETELESNYYFPNTTTVDVEKLFHNNSTRVDLGYAMTSYKIPLFYDGQGKLYYRVRAVNFHSSGTRADGAWSTAGIINYTGHNNDLNWQARTSFAEEGKRKSVMEYFDGSLRSRQTVTKENVNNTTITAETLYDYEGRPAIQILPAPGINTIIQYQSNLNRFNSQALNQNPAEIFDLQPIASTSSLTEPLLNTTGTSQYYSSNNPEINTGPNKNIPDAEGYPYTVTRYTPDATGRIMAQSGVGPAHKMSSGRETKYYYGTPAQEELDGLFGTEVGNNTHYFKNMVKDANGQMSVSYTDMHGRTIATALAGDAPANLLPLDINNPANYPNQAGTTINRNLLNAATNVVKNNAIEAINTILVSAPTTYYFEYSLAPDKLQLTSCSTAPLCYDCLYDLEVSITDETGETDPVVWKFTNVSLNPDDNCATGTPSLTWVSGPPVSISGNSILFQRPLQPGSYSVRKTLTLSESSFEYYKAQYLTLGKGICKSEQEIIDSVYSVLMSTSNCNIPPTVNCTSCLNELGDFGTFRTNWLNSIGNPNPVPPSVETEIQTAFNAALQQCNNICNGGAQLLGSKRQLMLADMMPYGGQYATETGSGSMYDKYNIFRQTMGGQPFYKYPWNANKQLDYYHNSNGDIDEVLHPGGSGYGTLNSMSMQQFAEQFTNSWANALLPHHPEYDRLVYAEANLSSSYTWLNNFNAANTYLAAQGAGYIMTSNATLIDPFYIVAPGKKSEMEGWITNNYAGSNLSLWMMARGDVKCKNIMDLNSRQFCYNNYNSGIKVPPFADVTSTTEQDQMWKAFRNLYAYARDYQVNAFVAATVPLGDDATLIAQGYQLRFGNNQQLAQQSGWTWFPPAPGDPPILPPGFPGGSAGADYQSRCESYIPTWKNQLLQCTVLAGLPQATRDQILNEITAGMVTVCVNGSDAANPNGSSTVRPSYPGTPRSFEEVINQAYLNHGINPPKDYLCNPYVIEFPKPYGKNPVLMQEYTTLVDSCACAHFDSLKIRVTQAGGNPYQFQSVNNYLLTQNMDTLTSVLYQALLGCPGYQEWICDTVQEFVTVNCYDPFPCTTNCYLKPTREGGCDPSPPATCQEFQSAISCFFENYTINPKTCQNNFTSFFNGWFCTSMTWTDISNLYQSLCGGTLQVCWPCTTTVLCSVEVNCHWKFRPYTLSVPQPLPDYLKCGGWPPQGKCLKCDTLQVYTNEFKTIFTAPYNAGPHFTGTNLTNEQIEQNILYARFLNFRTGFQYNWMEYAQAATTANCDPLGAGGGPQTVICRNNKPLNDTTGVFVIDTPCHRIRIMAVELGQNIYQQQQLTLLANFEAAYRAKCMAAKDAETFTVIYTNKEYHYTLYYYDLTGILVKTVPPKGVYPDYSFNFLNSVRAARNNCKGDENDPCTLITPPHSFATNYRYNSLNQLVQQHSPDGGHSKFWYDKLGRLVISQNAQQSIESKYSYSKYDVLGRVIEVGQKPHTTPMTQTISQDNAQLSAWLNSQGGVKEQITFTGYDVEFVPNRQPLIHQQNLRNRVSYTAYRNFENDPQPPPYYTGTLYTYDIHGNVDTLLQDYSGIPEMSSTSNTFKRFTYKYDLITGKVNMVSYQPGEWDAFYHKYEYDAENSLTQAWTSRDKIYWERDAAYNYYKYGPLSRMMIGQQHVQGIDYAYTIQGWLKGVNGTNAPTGDIGVYDIGEDGLTGGININVAKDIYGFGLHYFDDGINRDYQGIGVGMPYFAEPNNPAFTSLFSGNIGAMSVNIGPFSNKPAATNNELPLFYNYRYDQLNRIRSMDAYWGLGYAGRNANRWIPQLLADYKETITYDPNGNILSYLRNGSPSVPGKQQQMDDLGYNYIAGKNQLRQVTDNPAYSGFYSEDIDNQANPNNYTYDAIGNLKTDYGEGISNVEWTMYGKIKSIAKGVNDIIYSYDADGNRISKTANGKTTVYVRDANGNIMSIYEKTTAGAIEHVESHLYGSSRIGIVNKLTVSTNTVSLSGSYGVATISTFTRGEKSYELSNHLGNVFVTISDKKLQVSATTVVEYYRAEVLSAVDYYPFGMSMPGRSTSITGYRFGFNGQERSLEIHGNSFTAEYWEYDARIGRRWNIDPIMKEWESPYASLANNPLNFVDPNGADAMGRAKRKAKKRLEELQSSSPGYNWAYTIEDNEDRNIQVYFSGVNPNDGMDVAVAKSFIEKRSGFGKFLRRVDKVVDYIPVVGPIKRSIKHASNGEWGKALLNLGEAAFDVVTLGPGTIVKAGFKEGTKILGKKMLTETVDNYVSEQTGVSPSMLKKPKKKAQLGVKNAEDVSEAGKKSLRNGHLAGKVHPKTGVPFDKDGFPDFSGHLYTKGINDVKIKTTGKRDLDELAANAEAGYEVTPKGYTWHHHQESGRMQLVDSDIHSKTGHTGGFSLNKPK